MQEESHTVGKTVAVPTKRTVAAAVSQFASAEARTTFYTHLEAAQTAHLDGRLDDAQQQAMRALRLKAHPQVFIILESIARQRGDFVKAKELRLLHAFAANDAVLWRELYLEYLQSGEFYRAVVCLKRLTALSKDAQEKRQLILDRADLLIGLSELRQARTAYEDLWRRSECTDFEVFALLASLYFQLGRSRALHNLIQQGKRVLLRQHNEDGETQPTSEFDVKGYVTLVNVECEVLLERGLYSEVIVAVQKASQLLHVPEHQLHPDLVVRCAIAHCLMGNKEQCLAALDAAAAETVGEDYNDIFFDAAEALIKAGWYPEARRLLGRLMNDDPQLGELPALQYVLGRVAVGLGNVTVARDHFLRVLQKEPSHARTRIELSRLAVGIDDYDEAREHVEVRPTDDPFDAVVLRSELCKVDFLRKDYVRCVEAGNAVLQLLEVQVEDEFSVATGASKRRDGGMAYTPTLLRAASSILPASQIAASQQLQGSASSLVASSVTGGLSRSASSICASFVAGTTARGSVLLSKRNSIVGSSVAASSIAGGRGYNTAPGEIFRFHKSGKRVLREPQEPAAPKPTQPPPPGGSIDVGKLADLDEFDGGWNGNSDDDDQAHFISLPSAGSMAKDVDSEGFALPTLPSLEEIANTIDDPVTRALFVSATAGVSQSQPTTQTDELSLLEPQLNRQGAGKLDEIAQWQQARMAHQTRVAGADVLRLLGVQGIVDLTRRVVASYEALGQKIEAKDVARYVRVQLPNLPLVKRQDEGKRAMQLLSRIHLRLSAATLDPLDALHSAVGSLGHLADRNFDDAEVQELWSLVSRLENASPDTSKVLERFAQSGSPRSRDPQLAVATGHRALRLRTYPQAARCYWAALAHYPNDAMLYLLISICYLFLTMRKGMDADERHRCVQHASAFLEHYIDASKGALSRDPLVAIEVAFNTARAFHHLWLPNLAIPLYEQCLALCDAFLSAGGLAVAVPGFSDCLDVAAVRQALVATESEEGTKLQRVSWCVAMQRAAAHGLGLIYRDGNRFELDESLSTGEEAQRVDRYNQCLRRARSLSV